MGIAGLLRALKGLPVTTRVALRGQSVVIDGPALVHRLWEMLLKDRRGSSVILGQVTYSEVSQTVINWLDDLRSQDVQVRKIYFDGYLPPFKWETRKQRLVKQTENIHALPTVYRNGVGLDPRKSSLKGRISSMRFSSHDVHHVNSLPKHPFLVPAVVESLRLSHWSSVVQVVPGEADAFCAKDITQNGGLLLTTDSDLLLQDHGPKGSVVFLWDIYDQEDHGPIEPVLRKNDWAENLAGPLGTATSYSRSHVEDYFGVRAFGGLPKLIFDWQQGGGGSLSQASMRLRSNSASRYDEKAYDEFLQEHIPVEYVSEAHPVVNLLSSLDPRVSELVLQLLGVKVVKETLATKRAIPAPKFGPRGPEELSIFLPSMIENTSQRSCWEYSQTTRQLAYGLARGFAQKSHNSVIEYRALQSLNGGRNIPIPKAGTVDNWCELLATALDQLTPARDTKFPYSKWMALAFYQEVQRSREEDSRSVAVELVTQALNNNNLEPTEYSWQHLHLAAIIQASFYSVRILRQILDVRSSLSTEHMTSAQKRLQEHLKTLPPITEWPTVVELCSDLHTFGKGEGLAAISRALGIPQIQLKKSAAKKKKRPRTPTKNDSQKPPSKMARSRNPFDALDMA